MGVRDAETTAFSRKQIEQLDLAPEITEALVAIQCEVADAYREDFIALMAAVRTQASALERIQNTLALLVRQLVPSMELQIPPALRVASSGDAPDVASVMIDPIGAGYTLSQEGLARLLMVSAADVSILVRAFRLRDDGDCAVVVRKGKRNTLANFPRAADRFRELVVDPPQGLDDDQKSAVRRVRKKLGLTGRRV